MVAPSRSPSLPISEYSTRKELSKMLSSVARCAPTRLETSSKGRDEVLHPSAQLDGSAESGAGGGEGASDLEPRCVERAPDSQELKLE